MQAGSNLESDQFEWGDFQHLTCIYNLLRAWNLLAVQGFMSPLTSLMYQMETTPPMGFLPYVK